MIISPISPPQLIITVLDETFGKLGYVVIDRPVRGMVAGGVRFAADVSPNELTSLARSMTYKWAFLNVPMGGAKAGICADPEQLGCERAAIMEAFGRTIAPLVQRQLYHPGLDIGTTLDDLQAIMHGAGQPLVGQQIDGTVSTALTVFETIRQTVRFKGLELAGLRVALEGFGKVGSALAPMLAEAGAKLIALSTIEGAIVNQAGLDVAQLLALKQQHGDQLVHYYPGSGAIAGSALFTQSVDLLIPGARPAVIHAENAAQIQASLIVPISNAPITSQAESMLLARGITVIPDFVANCGGILASSELSAGFNLADVRRVVEKTFAQVVVGILEKAQREGRPAGEIARALAWQNHQELNEPRAIPAGKLSRLATAIKAQGVKGLSGRFAWRIHQRWPHTIDTIHQAAADRFTEWGLGVTLQRVTSLQANHLDG